MEVLHHLFLGGCKTEMQSSGISSDDPLPTAMQHPPALDDLTIEKVHFPPMFVYQHEGIIQGSLFLKNPLNPGFWTPPTPVFSYPS